MQCTTFQGGKAGRESVAAVAKRFLSEGEDPPEQWLGKVTSCKPARFPVHAGLQHF
jgi:hypothetical protein